MEPIEAVLF